MSKVPPITFFMPAYNSSSTIEESLLSIINGNLEEGDEIIVVDDKSTDDTVKVLDVVAKKFPIKIIKHGKNMGGGAARNTAIKNSKYDTLFCLDSDNVLETGSVKNLREYMQKTNADIVAFREMRFFRDKKETQTHKWVFKNGQVSLPDILSGHRNAASSGNYLFTKKSWEKSGGYPEFSGALDTWGFGLAQVANGYNISVIPGYYYHRYGHASYFNRYNKTLKIKKDSDKLIYPYLHLLNKNYIKYIESSQEWFDNLNEKPIEAASGIRGVNGTIVYLSTAYHLNVRVKTLIKKVLKFILRK